MAKKAYIGVDGKARKIKKGYVGVENFVPRALPSGYTQVGYLQSSGTQYIDTGCNPNQNYRIVLDTEPIEASTHIAPFGARSSGSVQFFAYLDSGALTGAWGGRWGATHYATSVLGNVGRTVMELSEKGFSVGGVTTAVTATTFSINYPIYLFGLNNVGATQYLYKGRIYSCQIYDNGDLVRDFVPCTNSAGTAGLYDMVNGVFYTNKGSGTFTVGSSEPSVARKIKKAYIGIGGVARPCLSGGELAYYGTITGLSEPCQVDGATTVGNYAVFGIGYGKTTGAITGKVEAYNKSLVKKTASSFTAIRQSYATTSNAKYAFFAGGMTKTYGYSTNVTVYNSSLTMSEATNLSTQKTTAGATRIGKYAVIGGGNRNGDSMSNTVDAYDAGLTKTNPSNLTHNMNAPAAVSVGNYGLFCAGYVSVNQDPNTTVNAYDTSLTRSTPTALRTASLFPKAAAVGSKYALVAHSMSKSSSLSYLKTVDAYDESLTRKTATSLSVATPALGVSCDKYALFVCNKDYVKTIHCYDESLTLTTPVALSVARTSMSGTQLDSYILIAGGYTGSGYSDVVDVYLTE